MKSYQVGRRSDHRRAVESRKRKCEWEWLRGGSGRERGRGIYMKFERVPSNISRMNPSTKAWWIFKRAPDISARPFSDPINTEAISLLRYVQYDPVVFPLFFFFSFTWMESLPASRKMFLGCVYPGPLLYNNVVYGCPSRSDTLLSEPEAKKNTRAAHQSGIGVLKLASIVRTSSTDQSACY